MGIVYKPEAGLCKKKWKPDVSNQTLNQNFGWHRNQSADNKPLVFSASFIYGGHLRPEIAEYKELAKTKKLNFSQAAKKMTAITTATHSLCSDFFSSFANHLFHIHMESVNFLFPKLA